ncbi:hypothetical protein RJ640_002530 [Escallonia rubra]|uniref:Retrovirus-related Pol polyprotein from transposon TNT 1-94 n=1 Tax=Escallonia rubra TaxID=112253 RepID=A0AA88URI2_9ASTE|nr:hypothetical protein RJ640_002530 [Escallonia rubra]
MKALSSRKPEKMDFDYWKECEAKAILTMSLARKKKLYQLPINEDSAIRHHLNAFKKITTELLNVEIDKEHLAIILCSSLPSVYVSYTTTMLFGKDTVTIKEVTTTLLETDSLNDSEGGSHLDGLVAREDPKSDSRRNNNWKQGKKK